MVLTLIFAKFLVLEKKFCIFMKKNLHRYYLPNKVTMQSIPTPISPESMFEAFCSGLLLDSGLRGSEVQMLSCVFVICQCGKRAFFNVNIFITVAAKNWEA